MIQWGGRVQSRSPLSPSSLPSPLCEPTRLPSFIMFEPQCLPLSFPSWLPWPGCSVSAKTGLIVALPTWLPHCTAFRAKDCRFRSFSRGQKKDGVTTAFVWCAWDRICVGTGTRQGQRHGAATFSPPHIPELVLSLSFTFRYHALASFKVYPRTSHPAFSPSNGIAPKTTVRALKFPFFHVRGQQSQRDHTVS